ncbi:MAG: 5,10-methylenetetrahydromethanopterin reductase [Candidatus Bathyarchaeota archaeon BA1]|nr:MAG: 5,10-methylenetetrahydromethanopterin reductase [Candidatus Bathyarchaeota archaeon BA1]
MVKFGIEFVPKEPYWKIIYYVIQAERRGFDYLWITDHFNNRNVYVTLTTAAIYTNKITFGPGVTNPYLINPVVTAQAIASLNELAPGRVVLGIGAGDKTTLDCAGVEMLKPLTAVQESIKIIRRMMDGESVVFKGDVFRMTGARFLFKPRGKIPIYVGAQGPKMLELAGRIGDGVLINACHPKDIKYAVDCVGKGVTEADKKLTDVDVAAYTSFSVHEDLKKATKAAVPVVSFIVAGSPSVVLERHGINLKKAEEIREALKASDWVRAFGLVSPEMIEAFSVCGVPDTCIERINQLLKSGISQFVVGSPIGPNVRQAINLIGEKIIPHVKL